MFKSPHAAESARAIKRSRFARFERSDKDDRGFSLIEVLVTVTLIVVVMIPSGRLFYETQSVASDNSASLDASALATSVISAIAASPYGVAGLTAAHTDLVEGNLSSYYSSAYNTPVYQAGTSVSCSSACGSYYFGGTAPDRQLVTVAAGKTDLYHYFTIGSNAKPFEGYLTGVKAGTWSFTVTTRITWASSSVPACPGSGSTSTLISQAEKNVAVSVTSKSPTSGTVSVTASSIIYAGGQPPYKGSSYSSAGVPSMPKVSPPTVSTTTTGEIDISWSVPASGYGSCYAVSWIDTSQDVFTTGMLSNSNLLSTSLTGSGYITPPPSAGTSGTAKFAVGNLTEADPFSFYVTAYSANGVELAQSNDTPSAISPSGPIITLLSPANGPNGSATAVTVTGSGLSSTDSFTFGGGKFATSVTCTSSTSCTMKTPTNGTGLVNVVATDPSSGLASPPTAENEFSFLPAITALSVSNGAAAGGTAITITGTNLAGATVKFGLTVASAITCSTSTTCTGTTPAGTSGTVVDVTAISAGGTSFTSAADKFGYS